MPAKTEKQRRFMGAELGRAEAGKATKTHMNIAELKKFASKPGHHTPGDGTGMDAGGIPTRQGGDMSGFPHTMPRGGGPQIDE